MAAKRATHRPMQRWRRTRVKYLGSADPFSYQPDTRQSACRISVWAALFDALGPGWDIELSIALGLTMLPSTRDEFFEVFAAYNAVNWPASTAACPLAFTALFMAWRGSAGSGRVAGFILALMWAWVGLVYHGV
ncbi:DUF6064 family protein [Brevundimonas sp.]|uniref:DUF6064 family protein n=1 Tax=Brevundimonas sp. TaxID=1871086 RepID=UPI00351CEC2B